MQNQTQAQQPAMSIEQLHNFAMNVVENVCSMVCMPVEVILRPQYGTRYFPIPTVFFSAMLMIFLPLFSSLATGVVNMIPFTHAQAPAGLFSLGSFSTLYFLLVFIHGFRLYRLMLYPELEKNSEFEGAPLPFFRLIPGSRNFWFTRIVLEPVFVFIAATMLERIFIIQSGLATYLHIAAFMLAVKGVIGWHHGWEFIRIGLDAQYIGPIIAKFIHDTATNDELASAGLTSVPKNISPEMRRTVGLNFARAHSVEDDLKAAQGNEEGRKS
jgi:hypothetical protein